MIPVVAIILSLFLAVLPSGHIHAASPSVVATIPPVHSLAAMVMAGAGTPHLLLNGGETPHSYSLRPSQSRTLASADIIVRVGNNLEGFLRKPLRALAGRAQVIELSRLPGLVKFPNRFGSVDPHHHNGASDNGHDRGIDPHLWLHTGNAIAVLTEIARVLSKADPDNAQVYTRNAARASIALRSLRTEIAGILKPVKMRPFFVFHDAWQYFEKEFGLHSAGAIAVSPERKPGARRLIEIRNKIRSSRARCVFAEPQFPAALVRTVIRGTGARLATLDPLGAGQTRGPGLYGELMRKLANDIAFCQKERSG
jgi:zinc transport system substrate-binding protein